MSAQAAILGWVFASFLAGFLTGGLMVSGSWNKHIKKGAVTSDGKAYRVEEIK